ncbi:MAG: class I SAM-dependent methyltransferase [Planctomycetota bacterium]|jgi:SAM-dependent methyltransferase
MSVERSESERERWNQKYSAEGPESFGKGPSDWLVLHEQLLDSHTKGRALDVACGNGRNSLYLAKLGYEVDAVDVSDVVVKWMRDHLVPDMGRVHPIRADLTSYKFGGSVYQVIVNVNYLERRIWRAIGNALAPGGLLCFETFTTEQIDVLKKKFNRAFALEPGELKRAFPTLEVIEYREGIIQESGARRDKAVASLVARKPG